ncbi:MAG: nuclear transport factor 2 family protein [Polyangiaceae bacterium]
MPTRERVEAFIAAVSRGEFLESIPAFYAEDMTAQENGEPPRVGRDAQLANERAVLERVRFERAEAVRYVLDGDAVAIHWIFEMRTADGQPTRLEEIALQAWRGDRIVSERYFYDPAQRRPRALPPR